MLTTSMLWLRLDRPGHEAVRLFRDGEHWRVQGTAVFAHGNEVCCLDYNVVCDTGWRTVGAQVSGWVGAALISVVVSVDPQGAWTLNGVACPAVEGCTDLDLQFSASTNLLPIRRLDLGIGQPQEVRAAWLRFPGFNLEPLEQRYTRLGPSGVRYESGGGAFVADLQVNEAGLVTHYPGLCRAEMQAAEPQG